MDVPDPHRPVSGGSVPTGCTVLLGGARSGKSALAVRFGERWGGPVSFVATAVGFDDSMRERISRHRNERPADWVTCESPRDVAAAVQESPSDHLVIVDCLTLWAANRMLDGEDDTQVAAAAVQLMGALTGRRAPSVVVTNEVGLGVHPPSELGRRYQDLLGRVNQIATSAATRTVFLSAGRAVLLEDPADVLGW